MAVAARVPAWIDREQELHERALATERGASAAGPDDFGDPSYLEPLRLLLASYDHEARFTRSGALMAEYFLVNILRGRLRAERWWDLRPDALDVPIERPIIITGLVRTGSTALHYLMGSNPDTQCLEYWLATHPQPRPPRHSWPQAFDYQAAESELRMIYLAGEKLESIHHMTAPGPEECRHFLAQSFTDDYFEVASTVPTYAEWYRTNRHVESYRRHRKLVQLVGSYDTDRRWLLKYPVHIRHIDSLLEVYPDACIVWTHRDPARVLASYVGLCEGFRTLQERPPDRAEFAGHQLKVWSEAMTRGLAARAGREEQFHDVWFDDFVADPMGTAAGVYDRFDEPFTDTAEAAMRAWAADNPPGKFGEHTYGKDDFGMSAGMIHERFADYLDAFFPDLASGAQGSGGDAL